MRAARALLAGAALLAAVPVRAGEAPARRAEVVFFISLPFTALYSGLATFATLAVVQVGIRRTPLRLTPEAQGAWAAAAALGAGWIAWRDAARPALQ